MKTNSSTYPNKRFVRTTIRTILAIIGGFLMLSIVSTPILCRLSINRLATGRPPLTEDARDCLYSVNQPRALIIISPGIGDDYDKWVDTASKLNALDYDVYTYYQGYEDLDSLSGAVSNLLDKAEALKENPVYRDIPVVLMGYSLGGYACAAASSEADIDGIISIYGFDNANDVMINFAQKYVGLLANIEAPLLYSYNYFKDSEYSDMNASESLLDAKLPALIVGNPSDPFVTEKISLYAQLKKNPQTLPAYITLLENDDSQKGHSVPFDNIVVWTEIFEFLEELSVTASKSP